ncbi:hypothetical protein IWX49DRAFT_562064 [Phyllosticta citricarpa]|uniref:Uncharacterized protein n=1 Tax=Phyllosticta citricarpa TaxID=55181 RepID=A0ABR1MKE9_9PEZI
MGCLPSRPSRQSQSQSSPPRASTPTRCISPPIGGPIMVPSPTPPQQHQFLTTNNHHHNLPTHPAPTPKLTRADLLRALDLVSLHLDHTHPTTAEPITIIALGGALHVLHLRNRLTTTALQFFHPDPASPQNAALAAAAAFATPVTATPPLTKGSSTFVQKQEQGDEKSRNDGGDGEQHTHTWLTNSVLLSLPLHLQSRLAACAARQNDAIYTSASGRLRVLAAPWEYVVVCAVARMGCFPGGTPWDMADAVAGLRRWVGLRGGRPVVGEEVLERARRVWGVRVEREVLGEVEAVFEAVWGIRGVVW